MTSHPEFGEKTSALEVAEAFSDRIKGKNGKHTRRFIRIQASYLTLS